MRRIPPCEATPRAPRGSADDRPPVVKDADQEVIENLELLENLDGAADLELLEELSLER
ncbi:MAG: hypothetical protein AB1938_31025 [Myxococcota bacterium]